MFYQGNPNVLSWGDVSARWELSTAWEVSNSNRNSL